MLTLMKRIERSQPMKKTLKKILAVGLTGALLMAPSVGFAGDIGPMSVNGTLVTPQDDGQFYLDRSGNTMVRVDFLPALFLTAEQKGNHLTLKGQNGLTMSWQVGDKNFTVNGEKKTAPLAPVAKDDTVYLPLRALVTAIGDVDWVAENKAIHMIADYGKIKSPQKIDVSKEPVSTATRTLVETDQAKTKLPIDLDFDGTALYTSAEGEQGEIKGLANAVGENVLLPVQKDADLAPTNWYFSESSIIWTETSPAGEWRLYEKDRQTQEAPSLIDSAPAEAMAMSQAPTGKVAASDKYIAYVKWDSDKKALALLLYDRQTHKKKIVETTQKGFINLALSDQALAWSTGNSLTPLRHFCTLKVMNLPNGKEKTVIDGVSLDVMALTGDHLLAFYRPYGMNFIDQPDGTMFGGALWCYNLKTGRWAWQLDNSSQLFKDGPKTVVQLFDVKPVGKDYAIVIPETLKELETIPLINLAKGTVAPLGNDQGKMLQYGHESKAEEVLSSVVTAQNGQLLAVTGQTNNQNTQILRAKELRID